MAALAAGLICVLPAWRVKDPGWIVTLRCGFAEDCLGYLAGFMAVYTVFVLVAVPVYSAVPRAARDPLLLGFGLAFFAYAFTPGLMLAFVVGTVLLYAIVRPARPSIPLFLAWAVGFYWLVPAWAIGWGHINVTSNEFDVANIVRIALLDRTFRRALFCFYEKRVGRLSRISLLDLLNYQIGLPFLTGCGATPSCVHYLDSRDDRPEATARVVRRGAWTSLTCLACLGLVLLLEVMPGVASLAPDFFHKWWWLAPLVANWLWFLKFYLLRVGTEQLSVGVCRLFGHDVRDNFAPDLLLSRDFLDFWRRWNVLWREFLMSWLYYPAQIALARRFGPRSPWTAPLAGFYTFQVSVVFLIFPMGLPGVYPWSPAMTAFITDRLWFHFLWGLLVAGNLAWQARVGRSTRKERWWLAGVKIVLTFTVASLLRSLFTAIPLPPYLHIVYLRLGV